MNEKPILFLDVDGVLNVLGTTEPHERIYAPAKTEAGAKARVEGMYAIVPDGMKERLLRLWSHFEVIWATAWLGSASPVFCPWLDVEPCEYLPWLEYKLPAILRRAASRRWAWVDDDAPWELNGLGWTHDHVEGLIITPDPSEGLTDLHVERLIAWVAP